MVINHIKWQFLRPFLTVSIVCTLMAIGFQVKSTDPDLEEFVPDPSLPPVVTQGSGVR
jgi:hypothetical protein